MSSFMVPLERFVEGDFPMVCVRSGVPATQMLEVRPERAPSKRTRFLEWMPWYSVELASHALDSANRPTGRLPYSAGHSADTVPVLHGPDTETVRLVGVHPKFISACEQQWADAPTAPPSPAKAPSPRGPVEQLSLGRDPERAAALVDVLRSRGFRVGYSPGPGMQRIVVSAADVPRVSAALAGIDPDRFGH